jgi:acyl-coenzyme A thioesterase PaaI-like protein
MPRWRTRLACGRGRRLQAARTPEGERVRRLAAADPWVQRTGIRCTAAAAGHVELRLTLTDEHLNFNRSCHGGVIFTLGRYGLRTGHQLAWRGGRRHRRPHHLPAAPARVGDTLIARAHEVSRSRRLSVVRVDVTHEDGRAVSSFTGTVFITEQRHA